MNDAETEALKRRIAELEAENAGLRQDPQGPLKVGTRVRAGMCAPTNPALPGTVVLVGAVGVTVAWDGGGSITLTTKMAEALARAS